MAWAAWAESRQAYLDLAESAYQQSRAACRAEVERWRREWTPQVEWGYAPPASPVWVAGLAGSLPRSGAWTVWVKRAGGVLLLAMAEYYFIQMGKVS